MSLLLLLYRVFKFFEDLWLTGSLKGLSDIDAAKCAHEKAAALVSASAPGIGVDDIKELIDLATPLVMWIYNKWQQGGRFTLRDAWQCWKLLQPVIEWITEQFSSGSGNPEPE